MSKKTLNVAAIKNELEGASLFFSKQPTPLPEQPNPTPLPASESTLEIDLAHSTNTPKINPIPTNEDQQVSRETANEVTFERNTDKTNGRSIERSNGLPKLRINEQKTERPRKRETIRHTFDIFADQLLAIKEIALSREKLIGEKVLLGDLAKEAMDTLITKEKINK